MNRREFLLLAGVSACSHPAKAPRPREGSGSGSGSEARPPTRADDWTNGHTTQLDPSPMAARGDVVVHVHPDELTFIDAMTLKRVDGFSLAVRSFCLLPDGSVASLSNRLGGGCELDVIDAQRALRTFQVPACLLDTGTRLVPGASATELYSLRGFISKEFPEELVVYKLVAGKLTDAGTIKLERHAVWELNQMVSFGDGRVAVRHGRKLQVYEPGKAPTSYPIERESVVHLARGAGIRIWYSSTREDDDEKTRELVLTTLGAAEEARISVAPGRVTHMASGETGALAAMIETRTATERSWEVLLLDEKGAQKWRVRVDKEIAEKVSYDLNAAFVAITAHRVVVSAGAHGLFAWDAATGARTG